MPRPYSGHVSTSSYHSYTIILIGKWTVFYGNYVLAVELSTLAMIIQAALLSCTGMLTVMASSLYNRKLKLNACSVPQSE